MEQTGARPVQPDYFLTTPQHVLMARLNHMLDTASGNELKLGMEWYETERQWCELMASENDLSLVTVAGITAAFSVTKQWTLTKELVVACIKDKVMYGHNRHQVRKAQAIYEGASPLDELRGLKELSFYLCLFDPNTSAVVIDRHMLSIFAGRPLREFELNRAFFRKPTYQRLENCVIRAAQRLKWKPYQAQAVAWVDWLV